ncbi:N-alpha-acetyltransferase 30 [Sergentomyia squamirostris]
MEEATKETDLTSNHTDGTKKKRQKRQNKSKNNEGVSEAPPQTTMDIIRSSTTMDDLSQKLEERLNLKCNGIYNHRESSVPSQQEQDEVEKDQEECATNHIDRNSVTTEKNCSDRAEKIEEAESEAVAVNHCEIEEKPEEKVVSQAVEASPVASSSSCCDTTSPAVAESAVEEENPGADSSLPVIEYEEYTSELQMPDIMSLIQKDLSEPYSIYTYRYFIHNWPKLCFLAMHGEKCVGAIVCKLGLHRQTIKRGYIAMLAVDKDYRKMKIGTKLVQKAIMAMLNDKADEVVLETEITNTPALRLYENLGFVRDKRLFHYYLSGVDALRLKLWFR